MLIVIIYANLITKKFQITPNGFSQVYTIHAFGRFAPEVVSCIHVLLTSKTMRDYCTMFEQLQISLINRFNDIGQVNTILVDFELATHQAIRQVLPLVNVPGCHFHFCQALIRKSDNVG